MTPNPNRTKKETPLAHPASASTSKPAPLREVERILFRGSSRDLVEIIYREGLYDAIHTDSSLGLEPTSELLTDLIYPSPEWCSDQEKNRLRHAIASFLRKPNEGNIIDGLKSLIIRKDKVLQDEFAQFKETYVVNHLQELYHVLSTNFNIKIFNLFCQSLLKAEYLFDANQSELLKTITEYFNKETSARNEPQAAKELFVWAKTEKNPQKDKLVILMLCESCLILNHRIKTNLNPNDSQHFVHTREPHLYIFRYEQFNRYYITRDLPESLPDIIWIFPYLFQLLTDMTAIDHSFSIGIKEMSTLLNTKDTIQKAKEACDKFKAFCANDELQDDLKGLYNLAQIDTLQDTLDLLDRKTKFLIYKVLCSDTSKSLSYYDLMVDNQVSSLHDKVEKEYRDHCKHCTLYAMFDDFVASIVKHAPCPQSEREYEKLLFGTIQHDGDLTRTESMYKLLSQAYIRQNKRDTDELDETEYHDVILYNRKIIGRVQDQFIHYGHYLKKLLFEVGNADIAQLESRRIIERHLNEIDKLFRDGEKRILSCSFLTQHFKWCLRIIRLIVDKREHAKLGFEMVGRVNLISLELDKLVHAIEANCDAANYGSLFEDCFYRCNEPEHRIERLYPGLTAGIASIPQLRSYIYDNDHVVFIASTFLRPIGKTKLRETYTRLNFERKNLVNKFYLTFVDSIKSQIDDEFIHRLEKSQETIDRKLDGNRRSVIQILGIFSAFIALAASSLAASKLFETQSGYTRFILSMTLCLSVFVAMLQFVISDHRRTLRQTVFRYACVFTLILLLVILLVAL